MSPIKRTSHAVYDLKYHMVWTLQYRKTVLKGTLAKSLQETFQEIAERFEFEIDTMVVQEDHVHLFLSAPPRYSPSEMVQIIKSISGKMVFRQLPEVKKQPWGREFWNDGYFVRSVGDKVTSEVIRRYIANPAQALTEGGLGRAETHGYADTRPVAPNTTDAGRAQIRRVEVRVTK